MEFHEIERILDAYWAGTSTREEEATLSSYFREHPVPAKWREAASLFAYYDQERRIRREEENVMKPLMARRRLWKWGARLAAAIMLLIGLTVALTWTVGDPPMEEQALADTYEDPEEAYEAVREALLLMSSQMNSATKRTSLKQWKRSSDRFIEIQVGLD